jgi:hypothetical protein
VAPVRDAAEGTLPGALSEGGGLIPSFFEMAETSYESLSQ